MYTWPQPLLSEVELERTKAFAAEFGRPGGVGEKLQKLLEKRAEEKDSWVGICHYLYWLDGVGSSDPLMISYSLH